MANLKIKDKIKDRLNVWNVFVFDIVNGWDLYIRTTNVFAKENLLLEY